MKAYWLTLLLFFCLSCRQESPVTRQESIVSKNEEKLVIRENSSRTAKLKAVIDYMNSGASFDWAEFFDHGFTLQSALLVDPPMGCKWYVCLGDTCMNY